MSKTVLVGNSFPLSLIRRRVTVEPVDVAELQSAANGAEVFSFWGHANTIAVARRVLGFSIAPGTERPVVALSPDALPMLHGHVFRECWIVSPDYVEGFRPAVGEEVPQDRIIGWQVLRMRWI